MKDYWSFISSNQKKVKASITIKNGMYRKVTLLEGRI
jgi:hypothetical protein